MSQKRGSYKKKEDKTNKQQQDLPSPTPPRDTTADNLKPNSSQMDNPIQGANSEKPIPEFSEKKADGRKRGFRSTCKKTAQQQEEQPPASALSEERSSKKLQESQMVTKTQPRPEAKEILISTNTTISQRTNSTDSNSNQKESQISSSNIQQSNSSTSRLSQQVLERPTSIDIGRKIWSMCRFDASQNGCRYSSQDCRFIHLDIVDQAIFSDSKKLAKLAIVNWEQAKLDNKYQSADKVLLNQWANSDSNERNPLFIKYKKMVEEKDPEFAQITQELNAEEMELEELKNVLYIKKQRYMTELSSRLRQKILSKSRQKAFDKLLEDSAQKKAAEEHSASAVEQCSSLENLHQNCISSYQMPQQYNEQYQLQETPYYSTKQQQFQKISPLRMQPQESPQQQTLPQSQQVTQQRNNLNNSYQPYQSYNRRPPYSNWSSYN